MKRHDAWRTPLLIVLALACATACGSSSSGIDPSGDGGITTTDSGAPSADGGKTDASSANDAAHDGRGTEGSDGSRDPLSDANADQAGSGGSAGSADARAGDGTTADTAPDGNPADGPNTPPLGVPLRALSIATGASHACALLDNHQVKCWGENAFGALGTGDPRDRGSDADDMGDALPFVDLGKGRTATAVAAGRNHTCAILDNGSVKCWGWRRMIGLPPGSASSAEIVGDGPNEMGDFLPPLDLGDGRTAVQVAAGFRFSCALLDDGGARCWGSEGDTTPERVFLGFTAKVRQIAPTLGGITALFEDGSVSRLLPGGNQGIVLGPGQRATFIAGSQVNGCALLEGGAVLCAGPRAGLPNSPLPDLTALDLGLNHSCGLSRTGSVRCWGANSCDDRPAGASYWCSNAMRLFDRGFVVALGQRAVAVGTGGQDFSCALLIDGGVKCWTVDQTCGNGGGPFCPAPAATPHVVGGAVEIVGSGPTRRFGTWRSIDLGMH